MSSETDFLLVNWGVWQSSRPSMECKSAMLSVMRLVTPSGGASVQISDDTAIAVDKAVARLRTHDRALYELLVLRYVKRLAVAMIAREIGDNRIAVDRRLAGAIAWVDACLNFFAEQRENGLRAAAVRC